MSKNSMLAMLFTAKSGVETVAADLERGSAEQDALLDAKAAILRAYLLISKRETPCSP